MRAPIFMIFGKLKVFSSHFQSY